MPVYHSDQNEIALKEYKIVCKAAICPLKDTSVKGPAAVFHPRVKDAKDKDKDKDKDAKDKESKDEDKDTKKKRRS